MSEIENIKKRYDRRKDPDIESKYSSFPVFTRNMFAEREYKYETIIKNYFKDIPSIRFLEMGAGMGSNLNYFHNLGIPYKNIFANELLDERVMELRENLPEVNIFPGDAILLKFINEFDVVLQSTVFTSILDADFKKKLAAKMFEMIKPGGIGLWYDFIYNNPSNPDVKGIPRSEVKNLFPSASSVKFYPVTLAPPIGRKVGKFYSLFNLLPFLRTHVIAVIQK